MVNKNTILKLGFAKTERTEKIEKHSIVFLLSSCRCTSNIYFAKKYIAMSPIGRTKVTVGLCHGFGPHCLAYILPSVKGPASVSNIK